MAAGLVAVLAASPHGCAGRAQLSDATSPIEAWALCRFAMAGLQLPSVDVRVAKDRRDCRDHVGLAFTGGEMPVVVLCIPADAAQVVWKKTILHELGHVWTHENLGPAERSAFTAHRDCGSWNDPGTAWEYRGSEHAAEVIAWALMDRELRMITLRDHDPESLAESYRLLTGHTPPERNAGSCDMRPSGMRLVVVDHT